MIKIFITLTAFLFSGCSSSGSLPIFKVKQSLSNTPTYSIILEDMKEDGNFIVSYYHKYRVVKDKDGYITEWMKVTEKYYKKNAQFLGMSLVTRKDNVFEKAVAPPGYAYVGDSRYGSWRNDSRGGSFWEFYGKYRLFSDLVGGWYRPIYRHDYNSYRGYRSQGRTFFGSNNQYGSNGSVARLARPSFYQRKKARQQSRKSSFSNRVNQRVGRTKTSFRGRSGGFGK